MHAATPLARRTTAHVALVVAVALVACACDREQDAGTTLRVMNWATDLELTTEQRIADRFAARNPHVRVIVESITTNYGEKLVTAIASGVPPDVFLLDVPDIPAFVERGLVLDLTPYVERVSYDTAGTFPEVLAVFLRGNQLYAFPKGFTPLVVYYNQRLFTELGVPLPPDTGWTQQEFLETARAVTRDTDGDGRTDIYAVNFPRQLYEWMPWVWSAGGDILNPEGTRTLGFLDSEATVQAFEFLTSLVTQHRVAPPIQFLRMGDPMRVGRFYIGKQAMLISGHWHMPRVLSYAERGQLEIGVAAIPHRAGVDPQTVIYTSGWAVPANVRHKRLAVELAAFLAGEEAQRIRAAARLEIPSLEAVAREVAARDTSGVEQAFLRQVPYGRTPWGATVMDFHEIEELSFDIMDRHLLHGDSLSTVASEIARRIDQVIAR
ncbi:MAG: extracellular solute-binding protein [Gemmatimonadales bacterium]|nr:extracellular solute-binding protein [Gemmatimonadales bacterium]NIN12559.1 extracellular solute-binding protein [Gemmatimonadales bacterium]NIR03554.1 extracellular solute-binding protein [Gemmatimonadales bacterium]NIS65876.1 extracellular solute-binding protein [Gemmatimonadales bacterium]